MGDRCIGPGCSVRFRDKTKSAAKSARNILLPQYGWLLNSLQSDGVDVASNLNEAKLCYKCFKKYERKTEDNTTNPHDNEESNNVINEQDVEMDVASNGNMENVDDDSDNDDAEECNDVIDNDQKTTPLSVPASNQLPLLKLDQLFYGSASHRKCTICLQYIDSGLVSLPELAKQQLMFFHKLWCPEDTRICPEHLIGDDLHPDVIVELSNRSPLSERLSDRADQIINDLLLISHSASEHGPLPRLDFARLTDKDCKAWTGWNLAELKQIHDICVTNLPALSCMSTHNAIVLFWAKVKTNISWPQLSTLCGVPKPTVSRVFHAVLEALSKTVVPKYLGAGHMTRAEAINHNTTFTKCFYGDKVTLILDGTYIYIPKSSDHKLQRSSYSGQKKRNLVKFMSIVLPDGYVLDTIGPFFGNENDAKITEAILNKVDELKTWVQETDNFIVDRGFRDVLDLLKSSGYEPRMPSYLKAGQSQHESPEANTDRQCTKTRWVVESYHGRLKQWHMFKDQLNSNHFIPIIGDLVRTVSACLNGVRGPIYMPNPQRDARDQKLAFRMQSRLTHESLLAKRVKGEPSLSKRCKAEWKKLDASDIQFPQLEMEYLETVACGTYQLKQAPGYIEEHTTDDGDYQIWVYQHSDDLIRGQIQSRHKSQTKYNVWIQYEKTDTTDPVKDYYCICPSGKRTIGMCAHVASILYYLGCMAYEPSLEALPHAKRFKASVVSYGKDV